MERLCMPIGESRIHLSYVNIIHASDVYLVKTAVRLPW